MSILLGLCLMFGHDWRYKATYRVCDTCDKIERLP